MVSIRGLLYRWIYYNSIHNMKKEVTGYSKYYYENLYRKISKPTKETSVDLDKVENAIQKGIKWLESIQRTDGSISGRLWEIWDTANATLASVSIENGSDSIERSVNFLLQNQLSNGGFSYEQYPSSRRSTRYRRDLYCIEVTAVALLAMHKYEKKITPEIRSGINFLLEKQHECGGWGLSYMGNPEIVDTKLNYFPSITGYALRSILSISKNYPNSMLERALNFLKKTQHKDGSWGKSRSFYYTEGYAIRNMVSALSMINPLKISDDIKLNSTKMVDSSILYTKRMQNNDGSWSAISISSKSIVTSLFLQSLLVANSDNKRSINLAVNWLLTHQDEKGFWRGGYYGSPLYDPNLGFICEVSNDVFATSETLVALSDFKKFYETHKPS